MEWSWKLGDKMTGIRCQLPRLRQQIIHSADTDIDTTESNGLLGLFEPTNESTLHSFGRQNSKLSTDIERFNGGGVFGSKVLLVYKIFHVIPMEMNFPIKDIFIYSKKEINFGDLKLSKQIAE